MTNTSQIYSGLHIGCFLVSFVHNIAIAQRLEEFVTLLNKIIEIKESRGHPLNLVQVINEIERDPDLTDRVHA